MVDDLAATGEESEENKDKKSGPSGETAQLVVDGVNILAGHRPAAAVPTTGTASDASAASVETAAASGAVADAAGALGDAADAAGAVGDVADAAGSVVGSVLGILDGL
jgi:hypothetical protein